VPRDETAADSSGDGSKNTNAGTDPDLFMNTSGEDCNEEQDASTNPHILSESESDEREMDTIPPPNPPNELPNGSEPAHGTGFNDTAKDKNATVGGTAAAPPPPSNQAGVPLAAAAGQTAPAADTPAGTAGTAIAASTAAAAGDHSAASSSSGFFSAAIGSGPNAAMTQAGCNSRSGTFNKKLSDFSFCPTPETVKKIFSKK
jgi:hypothetical protein